MNASPEAARPKVFRLALAPSIVNPRVNRLWLIPDGYRSMPSDFDPIVSRLRELFSKDASPWGIGLDLIFLDAWVKHCDHDEYRLPGRDRDRKGIIVVAADDTWQTAYLFADWEPKEHCDTFCDIAAMAGASLPNRIRDELAGANTALRPDTAFAWWVDVMWEYSTIRPRWRRKDESFSAPSDSRLIGLRWDDPILASLSAIEEAGLVGPHPDKIKVMSGEWITIPISQNELARRMFPNDFKTRGRDAKPIFDQMEKVRRGNKWLFRLDTLPEVTRKKLEDLVV
jgi:hypothetical protein